MKIFYKWFMIPTTIGLTAGVLYIIDALLAGLFVENASFMWVAFALWTIFYGATIKDRIKGLIGVIVGFIAAIVMMLITSAFNLNIGNISISCLLGVLLINFAVMFLDKAEKVWLNSLSGVFAGIFLTFSGLGVGLSPLNSVNEAFVTLGVIVVWSVLGLICGAISIWATKKANNKNENKAKEEEN